MAISTAGPNDEEEKLNALKKVLKLDHFQLELESMRQNIDLIKGQMVENTNTLNKLIDAFNASRGVTSTQATSMEMSNPAMKVQLVSELSKALAELVKAWRGSGEQGQDALSGIGKQMITDLVRATVDDVQQRVYNIRKLPPKEILTQSANYLHEPG